MKVFVAEVSYYDPSDGQEKTLYFTSGKGFVTNPDDTPANTFFNPRIQQHATVKMEMYDGGLSFGSAKTGYGSFYLVNVDKALDFLIDCGLDGRRLVLTLGEEGAAYSKFQTILTATMDFPEFSDKQVTLKIRDKQKLFEREISEEKYQGNNALPDGIEGTSKDIKGNSKPVIFGQVQNVGTTQVNSSRLIYQVSYLPVTVTAVYDRGAALLKGADYTSLDEMMTDGNVPDAGFYRCLPEQGLFRLGSPAAGQVTADAETDKKLTGELLAYLAQLAGLDEADIVLSEFAALDALAPYPVGIYTLSETQILEVMNEIAQSVGAWFGFDVLGFFHCGRVDIPTAEPVMTLTQDRIDRFERQKKNAITHTVTVAYAKNHTVQNSDIAGMVDEERRGWLSENYRKAISNDDSVKIRHLLAEDREFQTALINEADATAEADRLLCIYSDRRDTFKVGAYFLQLGNALAQMAIGNTVSVDIDRYGLGGGKKFLVIGLEINFKLSKLDVLLWG